MGIINSQLARLFQEKIEFVYPVGNSIDMECNYFDGYQKIPCEADFNSSGFDLVLNLPKKPTSILT